MTAIAAQPVTPPRPEVEYVEPGDIFAAIERTEGNPIPVDSGSLLIVDPCHLPAEILDRLTTSDAYGVTLAVVVPTNGDGFYYADESANGYRISRS